MTENDWRERALAAEAKLAAVTSHAARWKRYAKAFHVWWMRRPSAESLMDESRLLSAGPSARGGFEFRMSGPAAIKHLGDAFIDVLDGAGAPNCIEVELESSSGRGCIVEVRRREGKTMAKLRDEAIARAERAERELAELRGTP